MLSMQNPRVRNETQEIIVNPLNTPYKGNENHCKIVLPPTPYLVLTLLAECCFTSTENVGLLGTGAQDGHLDFHTDPELRSAAETCYHFYCLGLLAVSVNDFC